MIFRFMLVAAAALIWLGLPAESGTLVGSKHDLTRLNERAGVEAMTGLAYNNYRDPCIYCHIPANAQSQRQPGAQQIQDWNRFMPTGEFQRYESETLKGKIGELGAESMLCLSCHDGSMAVDMVINKPENWSMKDEAPLHMRIDSGGGLDRCTQCHDGRTAHSMELVSIGRNLMDDHPVGVNYPGLFDNNEFFRPNTDGRFRNGIRLFDNKVECATCHDVHDPDIVPFLRVEQKDLCITCHNK